MVGKGTFYFGFSSPFNGDFTMLGVKHEQNLRYPMEVQDQWPERERDDAVRPGRGRKPGGRAQPGITPRSSTTS